jgi:hypothetical protein
MVMSWSSSLFAANDLSMMAVAIFLALFRREVGFGASVLLLGLVDLPFHLSAEEKYSILQVAAFPVYLYLVYRVAKRSFATSSVLGWFVLILTGALFYFASLSGTPFEPGFDIWQFPSPHHRNFLVSHFGGHIILTVQVLVFLSLGPSRSAKAKRT